MPTYDELKRNLVLAQKIIDEGTALKKAAIGLEATMQWLENQPDNAVAKRQYDNLLQSYEDSLVVLDTRCNTSKLIRIRSNIKLWIDQARQWRLFPRTKMIDELEDYIK